MTEKRLTVVQFIVLLVKIADSDDLTKFTAESSMHDFFESIGLIQKRYVNGEIRPEYLEAMKSDPRTEN